MPRRSTGQYPPDWPEIAQIVKDVAGWRCVRCNHPHDIPAGKMLTVHHFDMNKSNCAWWNLGALSQDCHLRIQAKVIMERPWFLEHSKWFRPYVAGYYAARFMRSDFYVNHPANNLLFKTPVQDRIPMQNYWDSLEILRPEWCLKNADSLIQYGQGLIDESSLYGAFVY